MADDITDSSDNGNDVGQQPSTDQAGINAPPIPQSSLSDDQSFSHEIIGDATDTTELDDAPAENTQAESTSEGDGSSAPDPDDLPGTTGQGVL